MPYQKYAVVHQKVGFKTKALAANIEELPHLKPGLARLDELQVLLNDLRAEQARLTASRLNVNTVGLNPTPVRVGPARVGMPLTPWDLP